MADVTPEYHRWQGIADYPKESLIPDQVAFMRSLDYRSDPRQLTLLPKTVKESGSIVVDLPKWAELTPTSLTTYFYGNTGYIYSRSSTGTYMNLHQAVNSHGNGLNYYQADDSIYYTTDTTIGRYGVLSQTPQFIDDYFGSIGGVPTNTNSLSLVAASSQYLDRADTASLSIISDLCLEEFFYASTLPAVGSTMTLISKWDESTNHRSYKMDILGISGYFGDGSDGSLTISADTTEAPIDSACSGTNGTYALTATNVSFAAGQMILIYQSRGTGAGTKQLTKIQSYTAGTITTIDPLNADYVSSGSDRAQVRVVKQHTNVTVNSGKVWSAKAWDSVTNFTGGVLCFLANGTVTVNGTIKAGDITGVFSGANFGYIEGGGGVNGTNQRQGGQGEGTAGARNTLSNSANGSGGGGGGANTNDGHGGGGGGGNASTGISGGGSGGTGGSSSGTTDLTTMTFGGAGGGGGNAGDTFSGGEGGSGAGILWIMGATFTMGGSGVINANGFVAENGTGGNASGGGGGAGGSVLIQTQVGTLGASQITATGGLGGAASGSGYTGGVGSDGRIHLDYLTSYTGTTSPTLDASLDSALVTTASYEGRLSVSSNGTNSETLAKVISIMTNNWYRLSISWKASTATATFYLNAVNQGIVTGTLTSINDNASRFYLGADKGAAAVGDFFNGYLDDARVWNTTRTDSDISNYNLTQLLGSEGGLAAYYKLNNALTDATANANDLTNENSATFVTAVPFSGATTRLDLDQTNTTSGHTYTTPLTIVESAANEQSFTPAKDPQKSIAVNVVAKGTGNVTLTVHDQQNNLIASKTINAAQMGTGMTEFIFSTPWRLLLGGNTYHFHLTSTVADTTIQTSADNSMASCTYSTYFAFLVSDDQYHPIEVMLNFLVFGNERYLATWDGITYEPNAITFPPGWKSRCFGFWNEYLAVGMWKGDNIYDFPDGRVYFWDGISDTFNFFIDVPEGAINAMIGTKGLLIFWAGYKTDQMVYSGGTSAQKIKRLPKLENNKYAEMTPGGVTMWKALIHYGTAINTDSSNIEQGVYSWGSINQKYEESLSYDYPISTGTRQSTSLKIGAVIAIGRKLLIGWQDNTAFGIDVVDETGDCFASGTVEMLIQDGGQVWKDEQAKILRGDFLPLATGESVNIKIQFDRSGTWINSPQNGGTAVGDEKAFINLDGATGNVNREYQIACDVFSTNGTSPTVIGVSQKLDDLTEQDNFADSL